MEIDPETAALVTTSAIISKKLLGPTADYLGELLQGQVQKRIENINRILQKAVKKLGSKLDEPGQVHPKLLKGLILDGSLCEDELTAEYYGGVLASSRTGISRDDRGAAYLELVSRLSTYQIRTHFIIYTIIRRLFLGKNLNPAMNEDRQKMRIYVSFIDYDNAMAFERNEDNSACFTNSAFGLEREDLLEIGAYGSVKNLQKFYPVAKYPSPGFLVNPKPSGFELYLWVHGHGNIMINKFLRKDILFESPKGIEIPPRAFSIEEKRKTNNTSTQHQVKKSK